MKFNKLLVIGLAAFYFAAACEHAQAQHGHLNAGALGSNPGSKLYFANGDIFAASSGYVKELTFADGGAYAGYYEGGISLTALPATINHGGPALNHSAPGPPFSDENTQLGCLSVGRAAVEQPSFRSARAH